MTLELPLFPSYLFIHIRRNERVRVLEVPGALAVVGGTGGEPTPLPDATIEALRSGLELRPAQPHPLITAGQRVRIRTGASGRARRHCSKEQKQLPCRDDSGSHHAKLCRGSRPGRSGAFDPRRSPRRRHPKSETHSLGIALTRFTVTVNRRRNPRVAFSPGKRLPPILNRQPADTPSCD